MPITRRIFLTTTAAAVSCPGLAISSGRTLLSVSGDAVAKPMQFDRDMLRDLDWREIETFTSFTKGLQTFAGPTLVSVLEAVGARGDVIKASAINDYTVTFPVSDAAEHDVLLALEHNGDVMRVRDKGPIWVVFPLSEKLAATQKFDNKMIWQLDRIVVE